MAEKEWKLELFSGNSPISHGQIVTHRAVRIIDLRQKRCFRHAWQITLTSTLKASAQLDVGADMK